MAAPMSRPPSPSSPESARHPRLSRRAALLNVVIGGWLLVAPFVLPYTEAEPALWTELIVGTLVVGIAIYRSAAPRDAPWLGWANVAAGAWLVASPFALGYVDVRAALLNEVIVGALILVMALMALAGSRHR